MVEPVEITDATGDERTLIVTVHQIVRDLAGTILFDGKVRHIYQMENGLARRMDIEEIAE